MKSRDNQKLHFAKNYAHPFTKEGVGPADDFQHELTQAKVGCAGTCLSEKLTGAEWPAN